MAEHSFTTFAEASMFAKQVAIENNKTAKVVQNCDVYIVYVDTSITSASSEQSAQRKRRSARPTPQTTSASGGKNEIPAPIPVVSRKAKKKKQQKVGLSAAAAKRSASNKNRMNIDPRSIFITKDIKPMEISGGLPSLGKRK